MATNPNIIAKQSTPIIRGTDESQAKRCCFADEELNLIIKYFIIYRIVGNLNNEEDI